MKFTTAQNKGLRKFDVIKHYSGHRSLVVSEEKKVNGVCYAVKSLSRWRLFRWFQVKWYYLKYRK